MDREIPKGNTDLYILSAACKWHPYAVQTLPVTSPLLRLCVCVCVCICMFDLSMFVLEGWEKKPKIKAVKRLC